MPTPFDNPIGGFTQGFLGGAQLGLQIKEQKAKVAARQAEIQKEKAVVEQQKFENRMKLLKAAGDAEATGTRAGRERAFNLGNEAAKLAGLPASDKPFDDTIDISAGFKEMSKAIKAFEGKTTTGGNRELLDASIMDAYGMVRDALGTAQAEKFQTRADKAIVGAEARRGQALLGQVQRLPGLQEEGVITPTQAEEAKIQGLGEAGMLKAPEVAKPSTLANIKADVMTKALTQGAGSLGPEEKLIFEKETSRSGLSVQVSPDGTVNVMSGSGKPLPAEQTNKLIGLMELSSRLDTIDSLFEPAFVGWFDNLEGQIRELTGIGIREKEIMFRRVTNDLSDFILRLRSGAQISPEEFDRMMKIVLELGKSQKTFEGRLKSLKNETMKAIKIRTKVGGELGFVTPSIPGQTGRQSVEGTPVTDMTEEEIDAEIARRKSGR